MPIASSMLMALPEIGLIVGAMVLLMIGAFAGDRSIGVVTTLSILLIVAAGLVVTFGGAGGVAFNGAFVADPFAQLMKVVILVGSAGAIAMATRVAREQHFERFEYPILVVLATTGMMMMVSANDLIALYLGLELQSLALYVVAAINRDSLRSTEAGLKYFVLGALSSGMLLYGASLIYGFTGHTGFPGIADAVAGGEASTGLLFGLVFLIAGLAFKVSAVPFHMWTPDVYEGAPTPVTAFFATAPKVAAMALFVRAIIGPFAELAVDWQQVITFIAIASMVLGAFAAIGQRNIKRLMAYSSIGHMGFALVGLAAGTRAGVEGVVVYLVVYLAMNLGVFGCILAMRRGGDMVEDIDEMAGLSRTNPILAFILAMLLFSLAGIPPLAGFFAKFYVFLAAIEAGLFALAVIGVIASVVGAYYYLRIVKIMYFDDPVDSLAPMPAELRVIVGASGAFVLLFVFFAGPVNVAADLAAGSFFPAPVEDAADLAAGLVLPR